MKFIIPFIVLLLSFQMSNGQVTINPPFPTIADDITVTFDATQGNAALKDVNQVYMHTGLITDQSSTPSDWKYVQGNWGTADSKVKMTKTGSNIHQISFNIKDYYGVPNNEKVLQLAFVFRNADGSIVGRSTDGSDIYTPLFEESNNLQMSVIAPRENNVIVKLNEPFQIKAQFSQSADIKVYDNETEIHQSTGTSLNIQYTISSIGNHDIKIIGTKGSQVISKSFRYIINPTVQEIGKKIELGININSQTSVTLALYAPHKSYIYVLGSFNDWLLNEKYFMNYSPENNIWWLTIDNLDPNKEYAFQYFVDGKIRLGDPYSEKVLDPFNDKYIEEAVYPNLMPYPAETNGILTVFQTKRPKFTWKNDNNTLPKKESLIIYELLMRDFLESHNYSELTDTLNYLEKLGINAIELMPVNEFEGNRGWGYNPSYHMALDKYYGTPEAFKTFIDEAHARGIAVILDVVYNHAFSQSPLAKLYWDNSKFRPTLENPWLNPEARHPFNVGYDFNHESDATKYFVDRCLKYWTNEYHVDGFRFDLSKGFTQKKSSDNNQMSAYDQSRIDILTHYANTAWNANPDCYVILEHFAANSEEKVLTDKGMMVWGNNNHQFAEASMGYNSNLNGSIYSDRGFSNPGLVSYMESHDEERIQYKNKIWGNSKGSYSVKNPTTGLERAGLAAVFHLMTPGPKMIWQFGELGYDYSINYCENGSNNENCRLSPKPIRWDYLNNPNRKKLFNVYATMNHLRKNDIFTTKDFDYKLNTFQKKIRLKGDDFDMILIGNFALETKDIQPEFTQPGTWYEIFSKDSLIVNDVNIKLSLKAGEYRLYSSKPISTTTLDLSLTDAMLYPNPVNDYLYIETDRLNFEYQIFDLNGKMMERGIYGIDGIDVQNLNSGMYFISFLNGSNYVTKRFLKM